MTNHYDSNSTPLAVFTDSEEKLTRRSFKGGHTEVFKAKCDWHDPKSDIKIRCVKDAFRYTRKKWTRSGIRTLKELKGLTLRTAIEFVEASEFRKSYITGYDIRAFKKKYGQYENIGSIYPSCQYYDEMPYGVPKYFSTFTSGV